MDEPNNGLLLDTPALADPSFALRSIPMLAAGLVALGATLFLLPGAWADGGDLRWQDQFDLAGGLDEGYSLAVEGGRVFASGQATNAVGNLDFVLRASDAKTGALLWMDQFDLAGDWDSGVVVAECERVFAAVGSLNAAGNWDFIVRAHDAQTGALLWMNQFDSGRDDNPWPLVASEGRVYAAGSVRNAAGNDDILVRAYNAKDGTLLWMKQFDLAGGADFATSLAVGGGRVYVGGFGANAAGNRDFLVRAYGAKNGKLQWMDAFDLAGGDDRVSDWAGQTLAVRGGRVFAGGFGTNAGGNRDLLLRAYDAPTGALLWMDQFGLAGGADEAFAVTVRNGRVYVGGYGTNGGGDLDFLVRAHDVETGSLLWMDQFEHGFVNSLAVSGGRVVAGGATNGGTCPSLSAGNCDLVVRTYDADTGGLLWMDSFDLAGDFDMVNQVAVRAGRVFAVGRGTNANGDRDLLVRAYDAH